MTEQSTHPKPRHAEPEDVSPSAPPRASAETIATLPPPVVPEAQAASSAKVGRIAAGLYLARHGTLITWPVDDLAAALLADPDGTTGPDVAAAIDTAAEQFRRLAEHVIADETGHPAASLARPTTQR